jgi:hypothetical protein
VRYAEKKRSEQHATVDQLVDGKQLVLAAHEYHDAEYIRQYSNFLKRVQALSESDTIC